MSKIFDESGTELGDAPLTDRAMDHVTIEMTQHEHSILRRAAQQNGETVEAYVRRLVFRDAAHPKMMTR